MRARLVTFLATLLLGTSLYAQMSRGPMRISVPSGSSVQHAHPRAFFLGSPFWADYYPPYAPSPQVIVVQPPPQAPDSAPIEEHKSAAPLLIEWQGDRYVRRTTESSSNSQASQPDYISTPPQPAPIGYRRSQPEPPPTTFIFRDGHRENSSDYSIISGVIHTRGDYWNTGESSKQIPLTQLDLPATLKANQQQGAPFRLPKSSNEVITRP